MFLLGVMIVVAALVGYVIWLIYTVWCFRQVNQLLRHPKPVSPQARAGLTVP